MKKIAYSLFIFTFLLIATFIFFELFDLNINYHNITIAIILIVLFELQFIVFAIFRAKCNKKSKISNESKFTQNIVECNNQLVKGLPTNLLFISFFIMLISLVTYLSFNFKYDGATRYGKVENGKYYLADPHKGITYKETTPEIYKLMDKIEFYCFFTFKLSLLSAILFGALVFTKHHLTNRCS